MKLAALALDYDGTIAVGGILDRSVRDAIAAARQQGIVVLLVTGRQVADLRPSRCGSRSTTRSASAMRRTTTIWWTRARWVLPSAGAVRRFAQSPMKSSTEQDRRPSPITSGA